MDLTTVLIASGFGALAALGLVLLAFQRRGSGAPRRRARPEDLDTVAAWPPEGARVLTVTERQAYELLRRALPGFMVLAQVPLSRFIRVPLHNSYADWLQRVGQLSADLVVCDGGSRALAVIDIRSAAETERSKRRHERLGRVLRAAGVKVLTWREGSLPPASEVRSAFAGALTGTAASFDDADHSTHQGPIPVPEMAEILAEGDALDRALDPVLSGFFDEIQMAPNATRH